MTQDIVKNGDIKLNNVQWQFSECLSATEYNRFSNASSSNLDKNIFEFLEQPHNDIHLAVGGFTNPELNEDSSVGVDKDGKYEYYGLLEVANWDMGVGETASFDPMLFLHHCNINRMFWAWQKKKVQQKILIPIRKLVI